MESALTGRIKELRRYDRIDSTNNEAKRYAQGGGEAPAVFAAREQTAGRGRMGRSFFSPADTGLYCTLLLPSPKRTEDMLRLTSAAAVATSEALSEVFGIETRIKWVNDIYRDGKKLAGILAEAFSWEDRRFVLIGIGINLYTEEFPEELSGIAASVSPRHSQAEREQKREALLLALTARILAFAQEPDDPSVMARYRARSMVLGREVRFTQNGITREGVAEEISDMGALTVRLPDGSTCVLSSGEITLRTLPINEKGRNTP